MFQLMRNIHLGLGLGFFFFVMVFVLSSVKIAHRDWFPSDSSEIERVALVSAADAADGRALARTLMERERLRGELRQVRQDEETIALQIVRPGRQYRIEYSRASGEARILERRSDLFDFLIALHFNHGFWHKFFPSQAWALATALVSFGLLALGATGIYLWFAHHQERLIGGVLLAASLTFGAVALLATRLA